jgi:predicted small secreted protein
MTAMIGAEGRIPATLRFSRNRHPQRGAPPGRPLKEHLMDGRNSARVANRLIAAALFLAWIAGSVGCNTTEGVGEDIEELGDSIDDAADDSHDVDDED